MMTVKKQVRFIHEVEVPGEEFEHWDITDLPLHAKIAAERFYVSLLNFWSGSTPKLRTQLSAAGGKILPAGLSPAEPDQRLASTWI